MPISQSRVTIIVAGALALTACAGARAQVILHNNANPADPMGDQGLAPSLATASGVAAPPGFMWSEVQSAPSLGTNAIAGFSNQALADGGLRFADDFTVTGSGWTVSRVELFVYQPGHQGASPPVGSANVRIWSGRPGDAGSTIIAGDTITNVLADAAALDVYRVFNSVTLPVTPPDTTRRVWRAAMSLGSLHLPAGVYWIDWQFGALDPSAEIFCPPVTLTGVRAKAGSNARVQTPLPPPAPEGTWGNLIDPAKPISGTDVQADMPFVILGFGSPGSCLADLTGMGGPPSPPDGQVSLDDILTFINEYIDGGLIADLCGLGGPPEPPDGVLTLDDILAFIDAYNEGC